MRAPLQALDCALYWPFERDDNSPGWEIEIPIPDGPEIWDDHVAGMLSIPGPQLCFVVEKAIKVLTYMDFRGKLYINDDTWRTNYLVIDFGSDKPHVKINRKAFGPFFYHHVYATRKE